MTAHEPIKIAAEQKVWRLRVKDFLLLGENGAFDDYARAELLDGEIWVLNAIQSRHAAMQSELHGQIWSALTAMDTSLRAYITPSLEMGGSSLPEPDVVVAEPHGEGFLPLAKVALVIEVSDTTLGVDLGRKQTLYAAAGIPEYWVADVNARVIHQMWAPAGEGYAERREVAFGKRIAAATVGELVVETAKL